MTWVLLAVAGGVGSVLRMWVGILIEKGPRPRIPVGTTVINVTGSFLLGLLTALVLDHTGLADLKLVLGVGLLGGYTTFSTASVEVANLALSDRPPGGILAVLHGASMLALAAAAGALGLWLG
ncbi:fluoride efflux transporter FluC [Tessaracoccus caeni]|uniref:fluoride efflux transporter FluC n=1 Tax=Tessaracoccus caeni TaxID=3031239 RepID=UPI0023DAD016|nr:CrcB family protein [Tessaracoccus caeni]MDF1489080.1 CrcB family protein [Tessaracoccus caeni]